MVYFRLVIGYTYIIAMSRTLADTVRFNCFTCADDDCVVILPLTFILLVYSFIYLFICIFGVSQTVTNLIEK